MRDDLRLTYEPVVECQPVDLFALQRICLVELLKVSMEIHMYTSITEEPFRLNELGLKSNRTAIYILRVLPEFF